MMTELIIRLEVILKSAQYYKNINGGVNQLVENVKEIKEALDILEINDIIEYNTWSTLDDLCNNCIEKLRKIGG